MAINKVLLANVALAAVAYASPAPQQLDFAAIAAAPTVASGPSGIDADGGGEQTATLYTSFAVTAATTAPVAASKTGLAKREDAAELFKRTFNPCCPIYDPWCFVSPNKCSAPTKPAPKPQPPKPTGPPSPPKPTTPTQAPAPAVTSCSFSAYTPYYAALATGYTTDPALAATSTTTANQPCPTTPEAGTYCGFLNPLDPCAPQPDGYGPVPEPDTPAAFLAYSKLHSSAQAAPTVIPSTNNKQYTQVFKDLNGATSAQSYLGLYTLKTYDVNECAAHCDCTDLCTAFNIYAERDPSLNPTNNDSTYDPGYPTVWGQSCPNPPSQTSFKCTLWGSSIDKTSATNTGYTKEQFQVVITASDGYDKTNVTVPETPPKCQTPPPKDTNCYGNAINSPKHWLGAKFFPGPFNALICSKYALEQKAINIAANALQVPQMFNAYYLHKNGKPHGTYCSLYNDHIGCDAADYHGGHSGPDFFECKQSFTWWL
ncbi:uncharacterized protein RCC_05026 [Ramularia collo-cygni]|uniref:Uncharacterized protein n=1 Tax=Ramularia collo-cygni TaxID=112498 RepID=A0A2D3V120_9PEZI|nr:uncharacterized protein RCC_05026 [Ramularia collo-cygni]CZT19180.1 uncharacterized protein RCC_05026 [Ramularia collo-cygni]